MVGEVSIDIVIVIYVDNILVGSKDVESHVKELNMVIHALTKAGFKLKPLKCKIHIGECVCKFWVYLKFFRATTSR